MRPAQTVICTVGTSLYSNLRALTPDDPEPARAGLASAFAARDRDGIVEGLLALDRCDSGCGAEINSLASLIDKGFATANANLIFCHSDTADGRDIGAILAEYHLHRGHPVSRALQVDDLQDVDPRRFRTRGLRNLAKVVCRLIREYDASSCAINATGGYKAQIAIAVLMGQCIGVPVYYKFERFNEIIAFPPMPVSFNFDVWMRLSDILFVLERERDLQPAALLDEYPDDAETLESLVDRSEIDGEEFVELSPTGQIFHETYRERFRTDRESVLPPAVPISEKRPPRTEGHHPVKGLRELLEKVTNEVPQVVQCAKFYSNLDLTGPARFWVSSDGLVGQYSDGKSLAKFRVETRARDRREMEAVAVALNEWLATRG